MRNNIMLLSPSLSHVDGLPRTDSREKNVATGINRNSMCVPEREIKVAQRVAHNYCRQGNQKSLWR